MLEKLEATIESLKIEYGKFSNGNNSAGTRARKYCQDIKKIVQEIRGEIQSKRNSD